MIPAAAVESKAKAAASNLPLTPPHGAEASISTSVIELERLGSGPAILANASKARDALVTSPNGRRCLSVTHAGALSTNSFCYQLFFFEGTRKRQILSWHASGPVPAIEQLTWSRNSELFYFVGSPTDDVRQLYSYNPSTDTLRRLSNSVSDVLEFSISPSGIAAVLRTRARRPDFDADEMRANGFAISEQSYLGDIIAGDWSGFPAAWSSLAPTILTYIRGGVALGEVTTATAGIEGQIQIVSEIEPEAVLWNSATGETFLADFAGQRIQVLKSTKGVIPVSYSSRDIMGIERSTGAGADVGFRVTRYLRGESRWENAPGVPISRFAPAIRSLAEQVPGFPAIEAQQHAAFKIVESISTPPKIVALNEGRQETILHDTATAVAGLEMAEVRKLEVRHPDGGTWNCGIYLPGNTVLSRCGLVLQTHGFEPEAFAPTGLAGAGFAAQALANKGIAVLQVDETSAFEGGVRQEHAAKGYIAALDAALENWGFNRERVGIQGWSATVQFVLRTLQIAPERFAAALLCDGQTGGYLDKLSFQNVQPVYRDIGTKTYGRAPEGVDVQAWHTSPGFNMHLVKTPILMQSYNSEREILFAWEAYSRCLEYGIPVELFLLPGCAHNPATPHHQFVAMELAVDWFDFWLRGERSHEPWKTDQTKRWRNLAAKASHRP